MPRELAFDSWIWPLLGLLVLPWTTLAYLLVWSPVVGVDGGEWIVMAIGFAGDLLTYSGRAASSRYQASQTYRSGQVVGRQRRPSRRPFNRKPRLSGAS